MTLSLVGFAVPQAANNAAQAAFAETPEGKNVTWQESYGASGDQSRAVVAGLKADYVHFSLEGDVTRLVKAGLVADDWNAGPNKGIVTHSVVVIVVRKGNPKDITGWDDLVKPGVEHRDPEPGLVGLGALEHPRRLRRTCSATAAPRPTPRRTSPSSSRTPWPCPAAAATPPRRSSPAPVTC